MAFMNTADLEFTIIVSLRMKEHRGAKASRSIAGIALSRKACLNERLNNGPHNRAME